MYIYIYIYICICYPSEGKSKKLKPGNTNSHQIVTNATKNLVIMLDNSYIEPLVQFLCLFESPLHGHLCLCGSPPHSGRPLQSVRARGIVTRISYPSGVDLRMESRPNYMCSTSNNFTPPSFVESAGLAGCVNAHLNLLARMDEWIHGLHFCMSSLHLYHLYE